MQIKGWLSTSCAEGRLHRSLPWQLPRQEMTGPLAAQHPERLLSAVEPQLPQGEAAQCLWEGTACICGQEAGPVCPGHISPGWGQAQAGMCSGFWDPMPFGWDLGLDFLSISGRDLKGQR